MKTTHFNDSSSEPPSNKRTYRLDEVSDVEGCFFGPEVSLLPMLFYICTYSPYKLFFKVRLKDVISKAVDLHKSTYRSNETLDLEV